jgi:hypothetical protein
VQHSSTLTCVSASTQLVDVLVDMSRGNVGCDVEIGNADLCVFVISVACNEAFVPTFVHSSYFLDAEGRVRM